jgi:hypothetical protein
VSTTKFCDQCGEWHEPPVSQAGVDGPDCPRWSEQRYAQVLADLQRLTEERDRLRPDVLDAGEASAQAAFWRARAIELGAGPDEYRLFRWASKGPAGEGRPEGP